VLRDGFCRYQVSQFTFALFQTNLSSQFGGSGENAAGADVWLKRLDDYVLCLMGRFL